MSDDVNAGFKELFEREMKVALPLRLPAALTALSEHDFGDSGGRKLPKLVGSASAQTEPMLVQADIPQLHSLPTGYFMAGFWGHGFNSYAFYWCEVTPLVRVFFRLPYGGAFADIDRQRQEVVQFLANWAAFVTRSIPRYVRSVVAYDSMREGRWEFTMADGTKARVKGSALGRGDFDALLAQAQAAGSDSA